MTALPAEDSARPRSCGIPSQAKIATSKEKANGDRHNNSRQPRSRRLKRGGAWRSKASGPRQRIGVGAAKLLRQAHRLARHPTTLPSSACASARPGIR